MRTILFFVVVLFPQMAFSLGNNELQKVQETVTALCRGGTLSGHNTNYSFIADGDAVVFILKGLAEISGGGEIHFTKSEWVGVQAIIQEGYVDCVQKMMPIFLENLNTK